MTKTKAAVWMYRHKFLVWGLLFGLLLALLLASCGLPEAQAGEAPKKDKGEEIGASDPRPGDIKVVDGVEYIYARNRRFQLTPYEEEYLWMPKEHYSPGISESITQANKKEFEDLERRIATLEELLKNAPAPRTPDSPADAPR
jgi:hypothetical protein